jgi:hypothetical protein
VFVKKQRNRELVEARREAVVEVRRQARLALAAEPVKPLYFDEFVGAAEHVNVVVEEDLEAVQKDNHLERGAAKVGIFTEEQVALLGRISESFEYSQEGLYVPVDVTNNNVLTFACQYRRAVVEDECSAIRNDRERADAQWRAAS